MSGLVLTALCLGLAAILWRVAGRSASERPPRWEIAFGVLAAPLLVTFAVLIAWRAERFGEVRLSLQSVQAEVGLYPLRLGGASDDDDLVVAGLPARVIEFRRLDNAATSCDVAASSAGAGAFGDPGADGSTADLKPGERPADGRVRWLTCSADDDPAQAFVSIDDDGFWARTPLGRGRTFLGALRLLEGDAVCVRAPCDIDGADWAVFDGRGFVPTQVRAGRVLDPARGTQPLHSLPRRRALQIIPGLSNWKPEQAIHPLRDYLPRGANDPPQVGALSDCERYVCVTDEDGPHPVRSFIFQDGGLLGADWHIVLADPGARMARRASGLKPDPFAAPSLQTLDGSVTLSVWEPRLNDIALSDGRRGRLQLRRTVTVTQAGSRVAARFATPPVVLLGACEGEGWRARGQRLAGSGSTVEGSIVINELGGRSGRAANLALPAVDCSDFRTSSVSSNDRDGDWTRHAEFVLTRLQAPWPFVLMAWAWAIIALVGGRDAFMRSRPLWSVLAVTQLLLALRVLIALAGSAADPLLNPAATLADPVMAYVLAPALFLTWARWGSRFEAADAPLLAGPIAMLLATTLWLGRPGLLPLLLAALWLGTALWWLLASVGQGPLTRLRGHAVQVMQGLGRLSSQACSAVARLLRAISPAVMWSFVTLPGVPLILTVVVVRGLIALVGVKERFVLPGAVLAVSVVYTPLLLIGFGQLLAAGRVEANRWVLGVAFAVLSIAALAILPAGVNDKGYALMLLPVALVAAWQGLTASPAAGSTHAFKDWLDRVRRPVALAWAMPAVIAILLLLAVGPVVARLDHPIRQADVKLAVDQQDDERALGLLDGVQFDQNKLRLSLLWAPDVLANAGTAEAEGLRVWSAQLADYTDPVFGRGFMSAPNLTALRQVQMTDNLGAIHLMSPFGRIATAALLVLLMTLPLAVMRATPSALPRSGRQITGRLALWCLFGAAAYMVLANLQLVPFTGRNIYLLASTSGSDLLEGLALVGLAIAGSVARTAPVAVKEGRVSRGR